ncbi:His Kinase A (phospho-acceptor) domain-containing protein [Hymenobacter gelipurpurascens]|uniref:histidine kinase n=1 Tax=Hymenobacter gelipurpurascens TaxID=89968 RepID=A0A212T2F3_9BACT|nr:ATP-binding protein [Hymenobacter gelipurpurascens]SNC60030.1 His Kinase A (phospho-acceptor) domain-containing protein [Hymenobacter gelipurpurascens]
MKWIFAALLVLLGSPVGAQHRYWAASYDSLRQALQRPQPDTSKLRTLVHLLDITELTEIRRREQALPLLDELLQLNQQAHFLQDAPYQELRKGVNLWLEGKNYTAAMDAMHRAVYLFDKAGHPVPRLLIDLAPLYNQMKASEARFTYFQQKLTYYRVHKVQENMAACYLVLGGSYRHRGDYNRAISNYLQAADLFAGFDHMLQASELVVAGSAYADWGNNQKALHYMKQAVDLESRYGIAGLPRFYTLLAVSRLQLIQGNPSEALRYAEKSLEFAAQQPDKRAEYTAYALVQKSAVLLQMQQLQQVRPLLQRAQHLADSLALPITGRPGEFALEATWAQYYTMRREYAQAEASWRQAYQKASAANYNMLLPKYLQNLVRFYDDHGQAKQAQYFARIYLNLADTLSTAQGAHHVAQYEGERLEQARNAQIAELRQAQLLQAERIKQRNRLLGVASVAIVLISALGVLAYQQLQVKRRTLAQLRQTQNQLVQSEKWAFVGEVSAGIAHELQNPLNFMKKFAEVSTRMVDGMHHQGASQDSELEQEILEGLRQNLQEISQHGMRASSIIRGMLDHSRAGTGPREASDLNALATENLHLAYESQQAQHPAFQVKLVAELSPDLPLVPVVPQDIGRMLLNLFTNAFYAVQQCHETGARVAYEPTVHIKTHKLTGCIEIRVRDNGCGMAPEVQAKVFQPFFTTKPLGEGTGLGLSLSHDIVKSHGGTLKVESREGEYTEFVVRLPA